MSDVITVTDLEETKKHNTFHVDVITGRTGDYATNAVTGQVQKTLPATVNGIDWTPVGNLTTDDCTFTKSTDYAVDDNGTQWAYNGTFPFTSTAPVVPSAPDYYVVHVRDHNSTSDRNAVGAHDAIYNRSFDTIDTMQAFQSSLGDRYIVGSTIFEVVSTTTAIPMAGGLFANVKGWAWMSDFGTDEAAFVKACSFSNLIIDTNLSFASEPVVSNDVAIYVPDEQTILITAAVQHAAWFGGKCSIIADKKLVVDTQGLDVNGGLYFDLDLPNLERVEARNTFNFAGLTGGSPDATSAFKATGRGVFKKVGAVDCGKGWHIYGNSTKETSVRWEDCYTEGTTGATGSFYWLSDHDLVEIIDGDYTGDSTSSCNTYRTNEVTIRGGKYHGVLRGATVGLEVGKGTISGVYSENCGFAGVSCDLKRNDDTIPEGNMQIFGCVAVGCKYAAFVQARNADIQDMTAYNCTDADAVFRFNGDDSGKFTYDNIKSYGHTGAVIRLGENMHCSGGRVIHDSPSDRKLVIIAGESAGNTYIEEQISHTYTANFDLPTGVNLIFLDTTSGIIDVDLSGKSFSDIRYREVRFVICAGGANDVAFTIDGGSPGNGTVNGGSAYTWTAPAIGSQIVAVSKESGDWFVL